MPYVNFNVARVRNANDFKEDSFRTIKGGEHMFPKAGLVVVPEEIRVISGQLKEVENEEYRAPMELLFPIDKYPEESDVRVWLDDENIEMIDYYPAGEGKIDDEERNIYLVMGCSCSGKSTYVRSNAKAGDLIFDFDKIHQALTISENHQHNDIIKKYVFEIRDAIYDKLKRDTNITAWIINSSPLKEVRQKLVEDLKAKVIYVQRDKNECLEIAENERPIEWKNYINNYFENFDGFDEDENIEIVNMKKTKKEYNNLNNKNMERRIFANEFRVVNDEKTKTKKIIGYASVFYNDDKESESQNLGGFFERIAPNAFDKVIEDKQDVRALFNHNADLGVLGRTTAGTLTLNVDSKGLKYEIDTPDTQLARDLVKSMERGDISQSSFGFTISENGDSWDEDSEGRTIRTINQVEQLFDISPVVFPAYNSADSSVALRGFDNYKENKKEKIKKTEDIKTKEDLHYERNLRELKLKIIK